MYERFTDGARDIMKRATDEAHALHHSYIGTEHVLLAMLRPNCLAFQIMETYGLNADRVRGRVMEHIKAEPAEGYVVQKPVPHSPRAKKIVEYSMECSRDLSHNYVGAEHILLGTLREKEGVGAQALIALGLTYEGVFESVRTRAYEQTHLLLGMNIAKGDFILRLAQPGQGDTDEWWKMVRKATEGMDVQGIVILGQKKQS